MTNSPAWSNPARKQTVWVGFDPREATAFAVARFSLHRRTTAPIKVHGLVLDDLRARGLYTRPTERKNGKLIDVLSIRDDYDGALSTEFANSRFLVPFLAESGWALFLDCDMLVRTDIQKLFAQADSSKAVMVVKHDYRPTETVKMDGVAQVQYSRKNWSSVCLWNVRHEANCQLTLEAVNTWPGRDLHAYKWLSDDLIGDLDMSWNWLAGHSDPEIEPDIVHFTSGGPWFSGFDDVPFADEWRQELAMWAT